MFKEFDLFKTSIWILICITIYIYTRRKYQSAIPPVQVVEVPYEIPTYYKDTSDNEHAVIKQYELDKRYTKKLEDSIKKLTGIKNVNSVSDVVANTKIHVVTDTVIVHDTIYSFSATNPYYQINGEISPILGQLDISLNDTLHYIDYTRKHLFKSNETFIDLSNSNPYVHINKGKSIKIKESPKRWSIGPYVGYQFLPNKDYSIGVSLQYGLIRF